MQRRGFLNLLGLGGLALGMGPLAIARAQAAQAAPKRLIMLSHCHGWTHDSWAMSPAGVDSAKPWEVPLSQLSLSDFSQALAPLYDIRSRILPIDGLSLATAELDVDGNRHDTGFVHAWTGNWVDFSTSQARARSASIDQLVAGHIARSDRLPSLELGVDDVRESGRPVSYVASGQRLPIETSAPRLWQRLFGPALALDPLQSRQRLALDYAHSEMTALSGSLGAEQRQRMETHYALVRGLADRIEGMANLTCLEAPPLPQQGASYDERFDTMSQLIGTAFACDITRVVSLSLGEMPTDDIGWDHLTDDVHKGLAHEIFNDPEKHQAMTDYLIHHGRQVTRLVQLLESIPDVDGGSLMDNTLIVWGSELANGWHGYQNYDAMVIGGGWHFRPGRYLYRPHATPVGLLQPASVDGGGFSELGGLPHQHLLVSVAQAMGIDTDSVGIKHTQGQRGDHVDCRGPLEGLT